MAKTYESAKRFGKEGFRTTRRMPRTLTAVKLNDGTTDTARLVSGYVWR